MTTIILKAQREKSLRRRHPWIFSGAIAKVDGKPQPGETVAVTSAGGESLGYGAWSPHSQIRVRMWSFDPVTVITADFFERKLKRAIESRSTFLKESDSPACRLVNSESDGLPGLIVDRYSDFLVCQFLSAGAEFWKKDIVSHLNTLMSNNGIYERSDVDIRKKEGLTSRAGVLSGEEPPELVEIQEGVCRYAVDIRKGHKTGFYLDQRDNRRYAGEYAHKADVLNCFSYTGGFAVAALKAGAESVTNIDSSAAALTLARHNIELNELNKELVTNVEGDVFKVLRSYRDESKLFDVIILDPPKFAESKNQIIRAGRGYKDINLLACKLLKPGGTLVTFSCSGQISRELFGKIVADAVLDAGRDAQIIRQLGQPADHPVATCFPEGSYLKGVVCRVL